MKKSIDARGLACPKPVIRVKQTFDEGGFSELEVIVDNQAAVENITRFCENSGHAILSIRQEGDFSYIAIENENWKEGDKGPEEPVIQVATLGSAPVPEAPQPANIFINSPYIGTGDNKLGTNLMKAFLYSLTEIDKKPQHILMMNGGVKIAAEGSDSLDDLRTLEKDGVAILVCGACLDFFGLKEKLAVGKISNMYEIASILTGGGNTVTVG